MGVEEGISYGLLGYLLARRKPSVEESVRVLLERPMAVDCAHVAALLLSVARANPDCASTLRRIMCGEGGGAADHAHARIACACPYADAPPEYRMWYNFGNLPSSHSFTMRAFDGYFVRLESSDANATVSILVDGEEKATLTGAGEHYSFASASEGIHTVTVNVDASDFWLVVVMPGISSKRTINLPFELGDCSCASDLPDWLTLRKSALIGLYTSAEHENKVASIDGKPVVIRRFYTPVVPIPLQKDVSVSFDGALGVSVTSLRHALHSDAYNNGFAVSVSQVPYDVVSSTLPSPLPYVDPEYIDKLVIDVVAFNHPAQLPYISTIITSPPVIFW